MDNWIGRRRRIKERSSGSQSKGKEGWVISEGPGNEGIPQGGRRRLVVVVDRQCDKPDR